MKEDKNTQNKNTKVYVAVSGGVDSSVALALLQEHGYDVTGVYFKTYKPDANEKESREHCRQQGMDAQAVCKQLDVPFKVFDLEAEYEQKVFDYMIAGYKAGQTPNPDIMCNKEIKFGIFAERAFADGADFIATGHYARLRREFRILNFEFRFNSLISKFLKLFFNKDSRFITHDSVLCTAQDTNKDQTYFLSQVSQEVLARTLFPIGEYDKSEVRKLAEQYGLHTASKKDSQGICFIGQEIDVKSFLKKYIPEEVGDVLSMSGEVIGTHNGAKIITIGERHGFTINPSHKTTNMPRLFVIERDIDKNTITVGTLAELESKQHRSKASVQISDVSWINEVPESGKEYMCRIRHRGELYKCTYESDASKIHFIDTPYAPASGQFIALYDGERCLGGGAMMLI